MCYFRHIYPNYQCYDGFFQIRTFQSREAEILYQMWSCSNKGLNASDGPSQNQRVDITLPFVCLYNPEVGYMPSNTIFIASRITAEYFLKPIEV